jgi:hypothetical protein
MKKSISLILCCVIVCAAMSQERSRPPAQVRESFQKMYPQSQPSRWNHENGSWSVEFDDRDNDNGQVTAHFDSRGRHIDTHVYYSANDIPAPVIDHLHQQYNGAENYQYTHIERHRGGDFYQVHFRHKGKRRTVYLDDHGNERQYYDRH